MNPIDRATKIRKYLTPKVILILLIAILGALLFINFYNFQEMSPNKSKETSYHENLALYRDLKSFLISNSHNKRQKEFICDGKSDQIEINKAIEKLPDKGGYIFLENSTYIVDNSITINKSNVVISGTGPNTTLKVADNVNSNMPVIQVKEKQRIILKNFQINGNRKNQKAGIMYGILFKSVEKSKIVNLHVKNFRSQKLGGSDGISLIKSQKNQLISNKCSKNGKYGISLIKSQKNQLISNKCSKNGLSGIMIDKSINNRIISNYCLNNNWQGISLFHSSNNNLISNNNSTGNGHSGIIISSSSSNSISFNIIKANSQSDDAEYDGIDVSNNSDQNIIKGNIIRKGSGTKKQRYGIGINTSGCSNNAIINNDIYLGGKIESLKDYGKNTIIESNNSYCK